MNNFPVLRNSLVYSYLQFAILIVYSDKQWPLHEKPYFIFSNVPKRWSSQKNCAGIWSFLYHEERWHFFFPKIWYFFLRTENQRWYFSKNTWKYDVFCMMLKVVFLFPTNMKLPFCQKSKDDLFPKNTPKDDISGITEKDDIHTRKDDIGILCTFMETYLSVSYIAFQ